MGKNDSILQRPFLYNRKLRHSVVSRLFFMHTVVQMKCVSKLTDARRTSREDGSSLLDY